MSTGNSRMVAETAVVRLVESELVIAGSAEKLCTAIALGAMKQDDWRLELEKALEAKAKP